MEKEVWQLMADRAAFVDPFADSKPGFVDPFETKPEEGGLLSDFGRETAKAFMGGARSLTPSLRPEPPARGDSFMSGFFTGPFERGISGVARAAAPLEMTLSPATGFLHSYGARGLSELERLAGEASLAGLKRLGLTKDEVTLPDRQKAYEQAQADIDKAMLAAGPARTGALVAAAPLGRIGTAVEADIAAAKAAEEASATAKATARAAKQAAKPPPVPTAVQQAQEELQQAGTPVDIPRGLTIENPVARAGSVALSKLPVVGTPLDEAVRAVPAQMGAGVESLAGKFSPEAMPPNVVGGGISQAVGGAAEREAAAARAAAEAEHTANLQAWEAENQARERAITTRQAEAEAATHRQFGNVEPTQMAENTTNAVQARHARQEAENQVNWREVNNLDAHANKGAFDDLHNNIERGLSAEGVTLDPVRTPNAWSMMTDMRWLSGQEAGGVATGVPPRLMQALEKTYGQGQVPPHILEDLVPGSTAGMTPGKDPQFRLMGRHAPEPGSPTVSVQGLDELRKRVGEMAFDATSNTDRRASNAIKAQFNEFLNNTLENHLAPGSAPGAKAVIQKAIDSHKDLMERFGYNTKNLRGENKTAARTLNLMATGDLGPEAVAQNLIGSGKPGTRPGSSPLHDAIMNAVENPAAVRTDMRGAYWNALTEGRTPRAIASNIDELRQTRMGRTLFDPTEHDLMRGHADLLQSTPEQLKEAARLARQNEPKLAAAKPGQSEQLSKQLLGRNRSDEQVLSALDSAMRKGGDIKLAARTWGRLPEASRNEVRGAWLRGLGGGGDQFSVDKFITNWNSYSDQAKAIMLPDRGHRKMVDNFNTLAKQYSENIKRYGNPSGTAQVSAWHKLLSGTAKTALAVGAGTASVFHPIGMAALGLGGRRIATLLARPAGARQLTRWTRMAQAYNGAPSTTKLIALQNATRLLAQTAEGKK